MPDSSSAPVTVGWYLDPIEAEIARGKLESAGLPAFLHSNHHSQLHWPITLALGGIRLQVPPSAAGEAMGILSSAESPGRDPDEDACPACGGRKTEQRPMSWRIALLAVHLFNVPLPFAARPWRCKSCGAEFHE